MARYLKRGMDAGAIKAADAKVRETVEQILGDIEARGEAAVRDLSQKFDKWAPASFRLTPARSRRAIAQVSRARPRGHQVRPGAGAQLRREAAGHHAGSRGRDAAGRGARPHNIPVNSIGCYVPGGQVSDGRLGAHVDRHRQGRRREAHHRLRAAVPGRAAPGDRRRHASRRRGRDLRARRRAGDRRDGARHRRHRAGRHARRARQRLSWRRPSASCSAASASICSPGRPRP